jgi:hypothetical protein
MAVLLLVWAVLLWPLRPYLLPESDGLPLVAALSNGWAFANLTCAFVFWRSSHSPPQSLVAVYAALLLAALKTAGDLHGLLWLPPTLALVCLADLVLSVALFVGMLRELPRLLDIEGAR